MAETKWEEADVQLPAVRQEERPALEECSPDLRDRPPIEPWNIQLKGVRCPVDRCPGPVSLTSVNVTIEPAYDPLLYSGRGSRIGVPVERFMWADITMGCLWCKAGVSMHRVPIENLVYRHDERMYYADLGGNPDVRFANGGMARQDTGGHPRSRPGLSAR